MFELFRYFVLDTRPCSQRKKTFILDLSAREMSYLCLDRNFSIRDGVLAYFVGQDKINSGGSWPLSRQS